MGFTHVYFKSDAAFHCAIASKCARFKVTVAKKTVSTSLCRHERIATLLTDVTKLLTNVSGEPSKTPAVKFNESQWLTNTSAYLYKNKQLDLSEANKKLIEAKIMELNGEGWPKHYEPIEDQCPKCLTELGPPVKHQGELIREAFQSE